MQVSWRLYNRNDSQSNYILALFITNRIQTLIMIHDVIAGLSR